jgi:hypothetical protein
MDLLRWWRFLHAVDVGWDRATRVEARDFSCWIQLTVKQQSRVGRSSGTGWSNGVAGKSNPITGKPAMVDGYPPATVAHSETVLRGFYDFHRDAGTGPILNPFPLDPSRRSRRAHAYHNPMDGWAREQVGRYRPKVLDLDRSAFVGATGSTPLRRRPVPDMPRFLTGPGFLPELRE